MTTLVFDVNFIDFVSKKRGLDRAKVAKKLRVSPTYLSLILNQKRPAPKTFLAALAAVLEVKSENLVLSVEMSR